MLKVPNTTNRYEFPEELLSSYLTFQEQLKSPSLSLVGVLGFGFAWFFLFGVCWVGGGRVNISRFFFSGFEQAIFPGKLKLF